MLKYGRILGAALALIALLALGGCGSDDSDDSDSGGSASNAYLEEVQGTVDELLSPEGTFVEEPTTSPTAPGEAKNIAIISCGQQVGACAEATGAAQEAADALGWESTLFDAKLDLPSASTGIRNAVAQGADGIFLYFIDCDFIKAGLQEAKDAGVPVVAAEARECDPSNPLFTHVVEYEPGNYEEQQRAFYRAAAQYPIAELDGESKAITFLDEVPQGEWGTEEIEQVYEQCEGCTLEVVRFPQTAYGTRLQGIAEQELLRNPDVNTVIPSFEASALEIYAAVRSSGKADQILTFVGEGGVAGLDLLREGANGYAFNFPVRWEGWGGIDALGRLFAGEEPVPIGLGSQLIDADHNLPESGPAVSPIDFEAMYKEAWGVD